jgi:hypothetical protein
MKKIVLTTALLGATLLANDISNNSIGVKIGTLGIGAEYTHKINDSFNARIGINGYSYSVDGTESDIDYKIDLDLQTFEAIADYHPFENGFRISLGAMFNNNEINFKGKPKGTSYTINDVTYTATEVGSLDGKVYFDDIAPYAALGYAGQSGSWTFTSELGAMYQGTPKSSLTVTCGSAVPVNTCNQLKADVAAEKVKFDEEIKDFEWYPVLSIGVAYRF